MARGPEKELQPATDRRRFFGAPDGPLTCSALEAQLDPTPAGTDRTAGTALRRRRLAVLAGHQAHAGTAVALAGDPEPSVRAAALGALARLGALNADRVVEALADSDPLVRHRASKIAGQIASRESSAPRASALLDALTGALGDSDSAVAEAAAWALGEWGPASAGEPVDALCRMAREHSDPLCREAAVAALGAIGAARALPSILGALEDRPAVRRRAAIALAAFDDPRAEDGLRRCLNDRDWQVRQTTEELLDYE